MSSTRTRKPRPAHEREVDRMLFRYADYKKGLELQQILLHEALTDKRFGRRTTARYEKQEGSPGGASHIQEEDMIIRVDELERRIAHMQAFIKQIEGIIKFAFNGDEEKELFVISYWFRDLPRDIRTRKAETMGNLPFLTHDSFYDWRNKIYARLAEVAGIEVEKPRD